MKLKYNIFPNKFLHPSMKYLQINILVRQTKYFVSKALNTQYLIK